MPSQSLVSLAAPARFPPLPAFSFILCSPCSASFATPNAKSILHFAGQALTQPCRAQYHHRLELGMNVRGVPPQMQTLPCAQSDFASMVECEQPVIGYLML